MTDDDLHTLLHQAVDDVRPRRDRGEVLACLAPDDPSSGGRWRAAVAVTAVAAVVAVVMGGLAWLQHTAAPSRRPTTAAAGHDLSLEVYYVGSTAAGPRLFGEWHTRHGVTGSDTQAAVEEVLGAPADPDYASALPSGTTASVVVGGDQVEVDFGQDVRSARPGTRPGAGTAAAQALVWTLDAVLQRPVTLRLAVRGRPIDKLLGDRITVPVARGSADAVLSPVSLALPEGARLSSGATVRGQAAAFEGDVVWDLRQGGRTVRHGYATAAQCCTLAPYAFTLRAPPGRYTLRVRDTDPAGGAGSGITWDTKDVEIR